MTRDRLVQVLVEVVVGSDLLMPDALRQVAARLDNGETVETVQGVTRGGGELAEAEGARAGSWRLVVSDADPWVCEDCGSEEVEMESWVDVNDAMGVATGGAGASDVWCPDCAAEVNMVRRSGWSGGASCARSGIRSSCAPSRA